MTDAHTTDGFTTGEDTPVSDTPGTDSPGNDSAVEGSAAATAEGAGGAGAGEASDLAGLDIFLPSPPPDHARQEAFLDEAAALALAGHPITVYLQDEDAWAFEECEPVRSLVDSAGDGVLPVTLLGLDIVVTSVYPSTEQMTRFAREGGAPRAPRSAAASACGPGGAPTSGVPTAGMPQPREAGGFAAQLMGVAAAKPRPEGGPEIGGRRNLMGGDVGDGLPGQHIDR